MLRPRRCACARSLHKGSNRRVDEKVLRFNQRP
jgi:hypothetical protein